MENVSVNLHEEALAYLNTQEGIEYMPPRSLFDSLTRAAAYGWRGYR